jgi:hypothetical protein
LSDNSGLSSHQPVETVDSYTIRQLQKPLSPPFDLAFQKLFLINHQDGVGVSLRQASAAG